MKDYMENVIVQINGGQSTPNSNLQDRELFVDTRNGYLYYGTSTDNAKSAPALVNAGISNQLGTSNLAAYFIGSSTPIAYIGPLLFNSTNNTVESRNTTKAVLKNISVQSSELVGVDVNHSTLDSVTLTNVSSITARNTNTNVLILGPSSYGTADPSTIQNPVEGQIYFKIT